MSKLPGRALPKALSPRTTDLLDYGLVYQSVDRHVQGVDMAKALSRSKSEAVSLNALLGPTIALPPYLAKFKGFYEASGLKQTELPDLKQADRLRITAVSRLEDIKQSKRELLAKIMMA